MESVEAFERLDTLLETASKGEMSFLDFLDHIIKEEIQSKDQKRARMRIQMAKFPMDRRLEDYDFSLHPSPRKTRFWLLASVAKWDWLPTGSHCEVSVRLCHPFLLAQA